MAPPVVPPGLADGGVVCMFKAQLRGESRLNAEVSGAGEGGGLGAVQGALARCFVVLASTPLRGGWANRN